MREATTQIIYDIKPIVGADKIERAKVLGWEVVVGKGEFKHGDVVVFCEIDSILPATTWTEFLKDDLRIKTRKFKGVLSQGIVFPLTVLPKWWRLSHSKHVGIDVTDVLGVKHYEKPVKSHTNMAPRGPLKWWEKVLYRLGFLHFNQKRIRPFPTQLVRKTDEVRIQSNPSWVDEITGKKIYITVKLDGTSFTAVKHGKKIYICSRNLSFNPSKDINLYTDIARKYDIVGKLERWPGNIAIQGEICGPSAQGNRLCLLENELFVFDVWDVDQRKCFDFPSMVRICQAFGLKTVPLDSVNLSCGLSMEEFLELAKGKYDGTENRREGIVVRRYENIDWDGTADSRISFKVINNEYLVYDEK